jgi:hypothetical protein
MSLVEQFETTKQKKIPWPLVRKRTIPTERPPQFESTALLKCDWIFSPIKHILAVWVFENRVLGDYVN